MLLAIAFGKIFRTLRDEVGDIEDAEILQELVDTAPEQEFSVALAKHCCDCVGIHDCHETELDEFLRRVGNEFAKKARNHVASCAECKLPGYAHNLMEKFIIHYAYHLYEEEMLEIAIPAILQAILSGIASDNAESGEEKPKTSPRDDIRSRLRRMKPEDFGKC